MVWSGADGVAWSMASNDLLDVFTLATLDDRSTPLWKRLRGPLLAAPLVLGSLALVVQASMAPSWATMVMAGAAAAVAVSGDLLVKRRWARIRYRIATAILDDNEHEIGRDWLPHERAAAKAAVREFRRLHSEKLALKEAWAEGMVWPIYFLWFAGRGSESLRSGGLVGSLAGIAFGLMAARAAWRSDVLEPLLARIAKRQLARLEAETVEAEAGSAAADAVEADRPVEPTRVPARVPA